MSKLTDDGRDAIVRELYEESQSDWAGFWEIARLIADAVGEREAARDQSHEVVRALLGHGLHAGDPPYSPDGFQAWPDQEPDAVVARLQAEWTGSSPMPDLLGTWFGR